MQYLHDLYTNILLTCQNLNLSDTETVAFFSYIFLDSIFVCVPALIAFIGICYLARCIKNTVIQGLVQCFSLVSCCSITLMEIDQFIYIYGDTFVYQGPFKDIILSCKFNFIVVSILISMSLNNSLIQNLLTVLATLLVTSAVLLLLIGYLNRKFQCTSLTS